MLFPLSLSQKRLWMIDREDPGTPVDNVSRAWRIEGDLHAGVLEESLQRVVRHQSSLRTTFLVVDGEPMQEVHPAGACPIERLDMQNAEAEAIEVVVRNAMNYRFDLARGPLSRAWLLRLSEAVHVFVIAIHHAVSDGWSLGIFCAELSASYNALVHGKEPQLAPLRCEYSDFARAQYTDLREKKYARDTRFWSREIVGASAVVPLIGNSEPLVKANGTLGHSVYFVLPDDLKQQVDAFGRTQRFTPFVLFLSAFQVLLHLYSGKERFAVGTPVSHRDEEELEPLIGYLINSLPVTSLVRQGDRFRDVLQRGQRAALDLLAHKIIPYDDVFDGVSATYLFNVFFAFHNFRFREPELTGTRVHHLHIDRAVAWQDLALDLYGFSASIEGKVTLCAEHFQPEDCQKVIDGFMHTLRTLLNDPDANVMQSRQGVAPIGNAGTISKRVAGNH